MQPLNLSNVNIEYMVLATILLPLVSFASLFIFAKYLPRKGDWLACIFAGLNVGISSFLLYYFVQHQNSDLSYSFQYKWLKVGDTTVNISILLNKITVLMLFIVNFIALLVNVYSIEYMHGKKNYERYFPYLAIFSFAMLGIVISNNLFITFMFWELVGFSSYLLIGFWYDKESAVKASKKAFLFNRIGDIGFLLALLLLYTNTKTFDIQELQQLISVQLGAATSPLWITIVGFGFFAACVGKSAQFPLQVWLPDAMEGPTPVSALIHAATMVAAGVYLMVKVYFLLTPDTKIFMVYTGATTALIGALPALFQNDIKKVLAYSTISQLGYMVMGLGFEHYQPSFFHLITHAFFKACLFLSAGAVIHAMHHLKHDLIQERIYNDFDTQDMRLMGGLYKKMPITFAAFTVSAMSLIGVPLFSGALSKEIILNQTWDWAQQMASGGQFVHYFVPFSAYLTLLITTLYVLRQLYMVFGGNLRLIAIEPKVAKGFSHLKENNWLINFPLICLAILSTLIVFSPNPIDGYSSWMMQWIDTEMPAFHFNYYPFIVIGLGAAIAFTMKNRVDLRLSLYITNSHSKSNPLISMIKNDWKMDVVYYHILVKSGIQISTWIALIDNKILDIILHTIAVGLIVFSKVINWLDKVLIDGLINVVLWLFTKVSEKFKSMQSTNVQSYIAYMAIVMVGLLIWILK